MIVNDIIHRTSLLADPQLQLKAGDTVVAFNGTRGLEGATLMKAAMNVEDGQEVGKHCEYVVHFKCSTCAAFVSIRI